MGPPPFLFFPYTGIEPLLFARYTLSWVLNVGVHILVPSLRVPEVGTASSLPVFCVGQQGSDSSGFEFRHHLLLTA